MRTQVTVLPNNELDLSQWSYYGTTPEWLAVNQRGFGDSASGVIEAQVVVDEDHEDDLQITEHPVQMGVVIHDHAFKRPATVRCRMGWSNGYAFDTDWGNVRTVYDKILRLQARRIPFNVYTGKRVYENMLVAALRTHTDQKLEYTLMADVEFREIVLVGTSSSGVGAAAVQLGDPESNTWTAARGPIWLSTKRVMIDHLVLSGIPLNELTTVVGRSDLPLAATGPTAFTAVR